MNAEDVRSMPCSASAVGKVRSDLVPQLRRIARFVVQLRMMGCDVFEDEREDVAEAIENIARLTVGEEAPTERRKRVARMIIEARREERAAIKKHAGKRIAVAQAKIAVLVELVKAGHAHKPKALLTQNDKLSDAEDKR